MTKHSFHGVLFCWIGVMNEKLKINGVEKEFSAQQFPGTIAELLKHLNIEAATVVAEIDGKIIARDKFAETTLRKGQAIELVRFVPGG